MYLLLASCLFFIAIHVGISGTDVRGQMIERLGKTRYLVLFSLLSAVGLFWLVTSYISAPVFQIWPKWQILGIIAKLLMLPAVIFFVLAFASPNPTAVGGAKILAAKPAAMGIFKITRHPFLWSLVIWAIAHIIANGDLAGIIFFGGLAGLALFGSRLIDRRRAAADPEAWAVFAAQSAWLPFQAMRDGRVRFSDVVGEIGFVRITFAVAVYSLIYFLLHQWIAGVALF